MISEQTRIAVLERDSWQCQQCGVALERGIGKHHLHHLTYDSDEAENLKSLCVSCHFRIDHSAPPGYYPQNDKATMGVSQATHEKVRAYIEKRQAKERYRVTHDIVIEEAIECLERHNGDMK